MQQLTNNRYWLRSLLSTVGLSLGALYAVVLQPAAAQTSPKSPETTIILIAEHRTEAEAAKRDFLNSYIREDLHSVFSDSGQYAVITFSPDQPQLKRAILTHVLDVADFAEPLKPESLHKIAGVIGARNILVFHAVHDKLGIKNSVIFEEIAAQDTWRTSITNEFHTEAVIGKRKLKPEEMAAVNVDAIARSLKIKTHLLQDLHLEIALKPVPGVTDPNKRSATTPNTGTAQVTPPSTTTDSNSGSTTIAGDAATAVTPAQSDDPSTVTPAPVPTKTTSKRTKTKPPVDNPLDPYQIHPDLTATPDGAQIAPANPIETGVLENIPNEKRAARYRESGDLPSTVLYLRHAVDDKPNDLELRRKLIQAYEDAQAPELAVAEIGRSLRLDSKNAPLFRMYGDSLYSSGKLPEALQAYQKAVDIDPKDVLAQIALGDIQMSSGDSDAALKSYQQAAQIAPSSPLPHRRLARAACQRAGSDLSQYAVAVAEIRKGRSLAPATETQSYALEYAAIMKIIQSRLIDILDQMDNTYNAVGRSSTIETNRIIADMMERANAAAEFIDKLPPAASQEGTQALYEEGATCVLSSLSYLKSYVLQQDPQVDLKLKTQRMSARHDITAAGAKIAVIKPLPTTN